LAGVDLQRLGFDTLRMNKPLRPLYDDNERWTEETQILASEIDRVLKPIVDQWIGKGYKNREIESVIQAVAFDMMVGQRILKESVGTLD